MTARATRAARSLARSLLLASGAFVLYGLWAGAANWSHGAFAAVRALCTQGFVSFVSTLGITVLMEWLFVRAQRPAVQFTLAFLGACVPMSALTLAAHLIMHTPRLLVTVAPVLAIGTLYCAAYSWRLRYLQGADRTKG